MAQNNFSRAERQAYNSGERVRDRLHEERHCIFKAVASQILCKRLRQRQGNVFAKPRKISHAQQKEERKQEAYTEI